MRLHLRWALATGLLLAAGCGAAGGAALDTTLDHVDKATGVRPSWRVGAGPGDDATLRVRALLAEPLGGDGAVEVALRLHPEVQAALAELLVAGGAARQAGAWPNPELDLHSLVRDDKFFVEVGILFDVSMLLQRGPGQDQAGAALGAARMRAAAQLVRVALRARLAYVDAAAAEARLAQRAQARAASAAGDELARALAQAGNVDELVRLRARVAAAEAVLAEEDAARIRDEAMIALRLALGLDPDRAMPALVRLPTPPPEAPAPPAATATAEASLDLQAARAEVEAAEAARVLATRRAWLPHLRVGALVEPGDTWGIGPAGSVTLPLFDRGGGRRAAAAAEVSRRRHQAEAVGGQVAASARVVLARVRAAHRRVGVLREQIVPERRRLLEEAVKQYNAMNVDAFGLLLLRRELALAEEQLAEATRQYWRADAERAALAAGALIEAQPGAASMGPPAGDGGAARGGGHD
ncbi:MAG: TolC family protein [Kofleriaceae bacterium]|nr:TolC family protein [Kofleriaceae bacterium]